MKTIRILPLILLAIIATSSCTYTRTYESKTVTERQPDGSFRQVATRDSKLVRIDEPTQAVTFHNAENGNNQKVTIPALVSIVN